MKLVRNYKPTVKNFNAILQKITACWLKKIKGHPKDWITDLKLLRGDLKNWMYILTISNRLYTYIGSLKISGSGLPTRLILPMIGVDASMVIWWSITSNDLFIRSRLWRCVKSPVSKNNWPLGTWNSHGYGLHPQ